MATEIRAIDTSSVHRICSGQVVLTLATAVKELVENSLDAGATHVEVRLKEYGTECIEVVDNGTGVSEENFEGLTLKHHTSKLQNFSDLTCVETFGFRGEALSSLCALAHITVITCHEDAAVGTKLTFDIHGRIIDKVPQPRQRGTTVRVDGLFSTLPVRKRELERNTKREFGRLIQVLNAYCLISTSARIVCTNQVGSKGNKSTVVSTSGNETLRENISNVFGAKQLQTLLEFEQIMPTEKIYEDFGIPHPEKMSVSYKVEGFLSSCVHGHGRSSADRQFYFINKRPCDHTKVSKLVNEVYHMYNRHQYPFVALQISLNTEQVDVNVTPDKRQVFLQDERYLLTILKSSLINMFDPLSSVCTINQIPTNKIGSIFSAVQRPSLSPYSVQQKNSSDKQIVNESSTQSSSQPQASISSTLAGLKRSFSSAFARDDGTTTAVSKSPGRPSISTLKQQRLDSAFSPSDLKLILTQRSILHPDKSESWTRNSDCFRNRSSEISSNLISEQNSNLSPSDTRLRLADDSDSGISPALTNTSHLSQLSTLHTDDDEDDLLLSNSDGSLCSIPASIQEEQSMKFSSVDINSNSTSVCVNQLNDDEAGIDSQQTFSSSNNSLQLCDSDKLIGLSTVESIRHEVDTSSSSQSTNQDAPSDVHDDIEFEYDAKVKLKRKVCRIPFNLQNFKLSLSKERLKDGCVDYSQKFHAKINPGDNTTAEKELQKQISKDMFTDMAILGQFNLGFIIAKMSDDLFIIDQHATDEKCQFETLQKTTTLQSQKLLCPLSLELTAAGESVVMDNMDIFRKNGFEFFIDTEAPPTERVKLTSCPVSKNWSFGKQDVDEMIFMLTDSPGVMCRPSRVRQMFASRACRKAIMIGTALDKTEMRKVVHHMADLEQPWNCPHGRPTMRHLFSLTTLPS